VAVITQRQGLRQVAGQRLEAAEVRDPFGVRQGFQTDRGGGAIVAKAQDGLGEIRRRDDVVKAVAEGEDGPLRAKSAQDRLSGSGSCTRRGRSARFP
jgi:hypothetical protein